MFVRNFHKQTGNFIAFIQADRQLTIAVIANYVMWQFRIKKLPFCKKKLNVLNLLLKL